MMRAFQCDICEKFETGEYNTITVAYVTYQVCTDCLTEIRSLISKMEKQVSSKEKTK